MINNCFNYVGSKDRLLSQIEANLDKSKTYFMDAFCGSGVVGVNEASLYAVTILNDACWQLMRVLQYFKENKTDDILADIQKIIDTYELSKENKAGYDKLRDYYNTYTFRKETFNPVVFYCLVTHAFNYNIHINKSGGFNVPFGKNRSSFNSSLRNKFINFQTALSTNKERIILSELLFTDAFKKYVEMIPNMMIYVDPPYLSSDSSYGRISYLGKWDGAKEKILYETLDYIDKMGGSFLFSNVIKNNGKENKELIRWSSKYNVIPVSTDYENCNYQRKNAGKTEEVLIRNY